MNKNKILLSIIVPFYNVEEYIEDCIRSMYNQDIPIENYEVICINDCSPDNSVEIIRKLQKEYDNIVLIEHTKNKRQGGARNTGLRCAKGEYIWFVDSDDYIMPNVFNILLNSAMKSSLDVLQFGYTRDNDKLLINDFYKNKILAGEDYLFTDDIDDWYDKINAPWHQIIRKELIVRNNIEFIENIQFEDTDYMLSVFLNANRVQYISVCAYNYRINNNSITLSVNSPIKLSWRINQLVRCEKFINVARSLKGKKLIKEMISNTLSSIRVELKELSFNEKRIYLNNLTSEVGKCRKYMTWRTWIAIKYGITYFI